MRPVRIHFGLEFGQRGENERPLEAEDVRASLGSRHLFDYEGPRLHRRMLARATHQNQQFQGILRGVAPASIFDRLLVKTVMPVQASYPPPRASRNPRHHSAPG